MGLRPDTQFMINLIMFFDPNHSLGNGIIKVVGYYPVEHWHSYWKFEAVEIPFYKSLHDKYFVIKNPFVDEINETIFLENVIDRRIERI